jgi:hypothetical protein
MNRRARSRGYTAVELMMSIAVFAAGVTGIMTMQRTAAGANRMAKNVALASSIAQAWQAQLATDATLWRGNLGSTVWLSSLTTTGVNGNWQLPAWNATRQFGRSFDGLGNPVPGDGPGEFCVHLRLTMLYFNRQDVTATLGAPGNGTVRTEVRVFWPREGAARIAGDCTNVAPATVAAATNQYYFVVETGAVRQP